MVVVLVGGTALAGTCTAFHLLDTSRAMVDILARFSE